VQCLHNYATILKTTAVHVVYRVVLNLVNPVGVILNSLSPSQTVFILFVRAHLFVNRKVASPGPFNLRRGVLRFCIWSNRRETENLEKFEHLKKVFMHSRH
jgi:hypothetical protein